VQITREVTDFLWRFSLKQSADDVKTDLELIHEDCGEHLCDAEAGDSLFSLVGVAANHKCGEE
jgi:hypothetical protein